MQLIITEKQYKFTFTSVTIKFLNTRSHVTDTEVKYS
jgi:hypothetical protein